MWDFFRQLQGTNHSFSSKLLKLLELEPIEVVSHSLPKGLVVCLGAFEMDARHAGHLHATVAVKTLWSEQESRDTTYRIANASTQDSRDEVCRIAALPQMEWSEYSGACAVLSDGVSSSEEAGGKMSSWDFDGGGGVSSKQGGGGIIGSPVDMFDSSRDGGTCMGGDGTCCRMSGGLSCGVLDRPMVVCHHRGEVAWEHHQLGVGSGVSGCVSR